MRIEPNKVHLVPVKGYSVKDPVTRKPLPDKGRQVEMNDYWRLALREGAVKHAASSKQVTKTNPSSTSKKGK